MIIIIDDHYYYYDYYNYNYDCYDYNYSHKYYFSSYYYSHYCYHHHCMDYKFRTTTTIKTTTAQYLCWLEDAHGSDVSDRLALAVVNVVNQIDFSLEDLSVRVHH